MTPLLAEFEEFVPHFWTAPAYWRKTNGLLDFQLERNQYIRPFFGIMVFERAGNDEVRRDTDQAR